ncbi:hypothetical protein DV515_00017916 [Chloebia gouldiae]|uniref:Uncharacterized protein n=1 Tax=Chloebia gouldiae TaxID=44316 RepID=A0A3L8Q920_CHLGU|nr:hypothetical protein DV515_00017916 [Chloebia gouldiae]
MIPMDDPKATEPEPKVLGASQPTCSSGILWKHSQHRSRLWIPIPTGSGGIQAGAVSLQTPPRTK